MNSWRPTNLSIDEMCPLMSHSIWYFLSLIFRWTCSRFFVRAFSNASYVVELRMRDISHSNSRSTFLAVWRHTSLKRIFVPMYLIVWLFSYLARRMYFHPTWWLYDSCDLSRLVRWSFTITFRSHCYAIYLISSSTLLFESSLDTSSPISLLHWA